jgi:uncharacterized repeat protein (TIGR03803 family)
MGVAYFASGGQNGDPWSKEPPMKRIINASSKPSRGKASRVVFLLYAMAVVALRAQTFTTLFSFAGANGFYPESALVQGIDGNLYGITLYGGGNDFGTIFKITRSGT